MEFDCRLRSVGCNYLEGYLEEWKLIALCDGPVIRVFMCEDREDFRISSTEPIFAIASYFGQTDSEILRLCWRLDDENAYLCIHTLKGIQIHLVEKKSAKYSHQFVCSIAADKLSKFAWHPIYLFLAVHRQGFVYFYKPAQGDPIKTFNMQNQNQCSGISWSHDGRSLMLLHSNMITTSTWSMSASLDDFLVDPCLSHLMMERNTPRNILSAKDIGFLIFYEANVADIESIRRIRDVQTPSFETELTPLSGDVIDTTTHVPNGKSDRTVSNMFNLSQILESSPRALVYLVQLHDGHCKVQHVVELDSNIKDPDVVVVAKDGTLFGVSSSNTPEVHIYSCSQEGSKPFHSFKISKGKVKGLAVNESGCMALIGEPGPKKGLFSTSLSAVFKVNFQSFAWKNRNTVQDVQNKSGARKMSAQKRNQIMESLLGIEPTAPKPQPLATEAQNTPTGPSIDRRPSVDQTQSLLKEMLLMEDRINARLDRMEAAMQQQTRILRLLEKAVLGRDLASPQDSK